MQLCISGLLRVNYILLGYTKPMAYFSGHTAGVPMISTLGQFKVRIACYITLRLTAYCTKNY